MSVDSEVAFETGRYRSLGLIGNPFGTPSLDTENTPTELEILAACNSLLVAIEAASRAEKPRPIVVTKADLPSFYGSRAIGDAQRVLANDDSLDVLYGYVQLYMMRLGRIRATLGVVAERLAFRGFDKTLEAYIGHVLESPDADLISYQVLGDERLAQFTREFMDDPEAGTERLFGPFVLERRPELAQVMDIRLTSLESEVDESESVPELDSSVGDAPGTDIVLAEEADATEIEDNDQLLVDYIVEYTKVHLSPVVARGLRVCRDRGLSAMSTEFKVTKAPRKTLKALVRFARVRFKKVFLIFDGFEAWRDAPDDLRTQVAAGFAEMRWMLETDGALVLLLDEGQVPELEEQYASAQHIAWDFPGLKTIETAPDSLDLDVVDAWLAHAALDGVTPMKASSDPVLSALAEQSGGSMNSFLLKGRAAIEDAAERGLSELDEAALSAGSAV